MLRCCNLLETGGINTWTVTEATGVGTVSQADGYGEKRRDPRVEPGTPRNMKMQMTEDPRK